MKKILEFILYIFLVLIFFILIDFLRVNKSHQDFYIGKKVVVGCDTLIVTGHSYRGYELSNGIACSFKYLENNIVNECK